MQPKAEQLFSQARGHGGMEVNGIGKTWLFFGRAGMPDKQLADLWLEGRW